MREDVQTDGEPSDQTDGQPSGGSRRESAAAPTSSLSDRVRSLRLPQHVAAQPSSRAWLPWALCAILVCVSGGLAIFAFGRSPAASPAASGQSLPNAGGAPADAPAPAAAGAVVLESKGYIIPVHQIQVSPKVSGMVEKLNFEEGKQVKKDDVLAVLESVEYKADRDRAKGVLDAAWQRFLELYTGNRPEEIRQAKFELDEAEAIRKQWESEHNRNRNVREAVAVKEKEQTESSYRASVSRENKLRQAYQLMLEGPRHEQIQKAWAELEQAEADLAKAQWRLDNCVVRAPVTGTILTKKAEEGNIVNPVAFNISASLCEMADLSDLEVDLNIQERDVANVFKGQRCRIRPEAFPKREYQGHVSRLMPIADRAKGAVPVRVKVLVPRAEEGKYLKPEMSVVVSFFAK
jgi:multidrug resistance efflux pump